MSASVDQVYHYPPELLSLLIDAISSVVKSKKDVVTFFQSAGVPQAFLAGWSQRIAADRGSVYKAEIARDVLCKLNELGDTGIRPRREVLRRIVQWEDFSTAYPDKRLIAQGLIANIQKVVNAKDSFTRMDNEREKERQARQAAQIEEQRKKEIERERRQAVATRFNALFAMTDAWKRGKALEAVLNELFAVYGISVREAFTLKGDEGAGIVEQMDGLIEYKGHLYLVEMKWLKDPVGRPEISPHLVSVYGRGDVRGLFISASGYAPAAISDTRTALSQKTCVLMELEEVSSLLSRDGDLQNLLHKKVTAAEVDRNPHLKVLA